MKSSSTGTLVNTNSINVTPIYSNGNPHQHHYQTNENNQDHSNANSPICMTNVLKDNEIQKLAESSLKIIETIKNKYEDKLKIKNQKNLKDVEVKF